MMLDDKKKAELDQSSAMIGEMLPPLWRSLVDGCKREGFSEEDSLRLVCAYIVGSSSGGIHL